MSHGEVLSIAQEQNQQHMVSQARAWVQWCFSESTGTPGSVFQMFSGKGKTQAQWLEEDEDDEDDIGGFNPTRIHATESGKSKNSSIPLMSGRCGGDIIRAISTLRPIHQTWIYYCYSHSVSKKRDAKDVYTRLLWEEFQQRYFKGNTHARTRVTVLFMLQLQINNARNYEQLFAWEEKRPKEFSSTITHAMWTNSYRDYWKGIRAMVLHNDMIALENIYKRVKNRGI